MFKDMRTLFGAYLIIAGVLIGLQQFGFLGGEWGEIFFGGLWALGAIYFAGLYRQNRAQWWFGFVALLLAGLTLANLLDLLVPAIGNLVGGAIFLGMIGVGFLVAYSRNKSSWWAIIPAGVMFSLAAVSIADALPEKLPFDEGGLLFLGIGLTFLVLSFVTVNGERLSWGIFPAIILIGFGLFVALGQAAAWNIIWPSLLILFGLYFLVNSLLRRA